MPKRSVDLKKIFAPSDATAFVVIALGLFIALFLDEMAVRLIGVCIAILGGVALFMMVSPRLAELSMQGRPPRPSDSPLLTSETRRDSQSKRRVFEREAFVEEYGVAELDEDEYKDEHQIELFPDAAGNPSRGGLAGGATGDATGDVKRIREYRRTVPIDAPVAEHSGSESLLGKTFGDGDEGSAVRVVGVKKKGSSAILKAEGLQVHHRERHRTEELRARIERERTSETSATQPAPNVTQPAPTTTTIDTPDGDTIVIRPRAPRADAGRVDAASNSAPPSVPPVVAPIVAPSTPPIEASIKAPIEAPAEPPVRVTSPAIELVEDHSVEDEPSRTADVAGADAPSHTPEDVPSHTPEAVPSHTPETVPSLADSGVAVPTQLRETRRRKPDVSLNEFIDEDHQVPSGQHEPRKEFDQLLNRVLMVIRSATNARTAAFFWVNAEKQQLVVEARITEATDAFIEQRKLPLGRDAVSQIAMEGRPEILTEISAAAELDLLPYYSQPAGTVSFIGVPVYYGGKVVGVLCADSLVEDAYSDITVGFFGQFTKLISGLVQSYTGKFDLLQSSLTLNALQQFRTFVGSTPNSIEHLLKALLNATITCMDVRTIGAVLFDAQTNAWTVQDLRSQLDDSGYKIGDSVDLSASVTGAAIMQGETVVVVGPSNEICLRPTELPLDEGQFIAIPLRSTSMTYGALFFDNHLGTLTQQDINIAETLGEQAGTLIEQFRTSEIMQGGVLLDYATGSMNRASFDMRMREEFARAVDYQVPLTVCLVRIDQSRALTGIPPEQSQRILLHVFDLVKAQLRDYDVVANIGGNVLAIGLIGYKSQQAQMWTENIRGKIASSIIDVDGRRFSVTVSIGVAEATPRDSAETLFANALIVLGRSEQQTNKVTVYA